MGVLVDTVSVIGSIVSIGGAIFSGYKAKKSKEYSDKFRINDTKERLNIIFFKLEIIQENAMKLKNKNVRGKSISAEINEYELIQQKINSIINQTPTQYGEIIVHMKNSLDTLSKYIKEKALMTGEDFGVFEGNIYIAIKLIKQEREGLEIKLLS